MDLIQFDVTPEALIPQQTEQLFIQHSFYHPLCLTFYLLLDVFLAFEDKLLLFWGGVSPAFCDYCLDDILIIYCVLHCFCERLSFRLLILIGNDFLPFQKKL